MINIIYEDYGSAPTLLLENAKKLIQERIAYLQSRPDVALIHRILQRAELEERYE